MALTMRRVAGQRVGAGRPGLRRTAATVSRPARNMAVYAYKVTLKTPSGEQVRMHHLLACSDAHCMI